MVGSKAGIFHDCNKASICIYTPNFYREFEEFRSDLF